MRKLTAGILLLLFATIQVGMIAWYCYRPVLHAVCHQLFLYRQAARSPGNQAMNIQLSKADYCDARCDDDELRWRGEVYDIVGIAGRRDSVLLTVQKDITENTWLAVCNVIQQQLTQNRPGQAPMDSRIFQWMFKQYVPAHGLAAFTTERWNRRPYCISQKLILTSGFNDIPGQPPEVVRFASSFLLS
jgi:hypothetical protein